MEPRSKNLIFPKCYNQVMALLQVRGLSKQFGKKVIFHNLSFDVHKGEILGLIGRSGCGKSTLLKILVGYLKPDSGKIFYNGKDITKDFRQIRKLVGYTTQENSFYEKLTVYENMKYYANLYEIYGRQAKERIEYLLNAVELSGSKKQLADKISGGMKRRLDFAISLLHNPELIILDEPTAGLDQALVDQFWELVTGIVKKENKAAIVSSHIIDEIERNCTRAVIMHNKGIAKTINLEGKKKGFSLRKVFREITK